MQHFTRVLLASSPYYSMVLSCWDRGQFSPVHDHAGSRNWIKVLQGTIDEVQYEHCGGGRAASAADVFAGAAPPQSEGAADDGSLPLELPPLELPPR